MICPNKTCKEEIPDDSDFCDYCGTQLYRCDKCGFIGTGKFCGKCGGRMSAIDAPAAAAPGATVVIAPPADTIYLCHPDGWTMGISDGDILGRTEGPHIARLGRYPVISSTHAKMTKGNGAWFITDLKSTNSTYVNGAELKPNIPMQIKQNDVIVLADVTFTVRENNG